MKNYPELSCGCSVITRVLLRGREAEVRVEGEGGVRQKLRDAL